MSGNSKHHSTGISRRTLLTATGAAAVGSRFLFAQPGSVLPLSTPGLDHLDIIVEDVETSSRFYMALLNTRLHAQPFRGAFRYFVLLGELNANREVGYLAIGAANGRGTYIGHFCTTVDNWRRDSDAIWEAMASAIPAAGLGEFPGATGFGGIFDDPDGIEIQYLPAPDTLVTAATLSDLVEHNTGPVTPLGVDHVTLNVTNLDRALAWYRILYGAESGRDADQAWFDFPRSDTRLVLQEIPYGYGSEPGIAAFGIKTRGFDRDAVSQLLTALGATVLPEAYRPGGLRFTDPDGITVELNPV
jgi:catechol 2,3-dioxygenase-like lactoylglutathione lyase family enzyme